MVALVTRCHRGPVPFTWPIHAILLIVASMLHMLALAQVKPDLGMTISRMCLWNADHHTWSTLHLDRGQVARLDEMRMRYPAVVDAQWIHEEEPVAQSTMQGIGPAPIPGPGPRTGLQAELRRVLSTDQLRRWYLLCSPEAVP